MNVDFEDFATQVNYLAAIGRLVVPRAFGFTDHKVLFLGYAPFDSEELGGLLPREVQWHEHDYAPEEFVPDIVVLGREGFEKGTIKSVLEDLETPPKIVPQEGFLDELLFGHDWWDDEVEALRTMVNHHRGLQSARSLGALALVGIEQPQQKKKPAIEEGVLRTQQTTVKSPQRTGATPMPSKFSWPSTEANESTKIGATELDLQPQSRLKQLGYDTTKSRSERWRILTTRAVPELELPKVASFIAWLCRTRKSQKGGREKFISSITEWEYDLARLKREIYPSYKPRFNWPDSEPKSRQGNRNR
ncbi:MAG: hypothetical protein H0T74_01765 [Rubrobacteraceae bacterium]|nr:hypothetical protein [Rubrobacteraceae bacterium]